MFTWTEKQIVYMETALEYTDYYDIIACQIAPYLQTTDHICDAGCGLGALGLSLKKYCKKVTCIDQDPLAIASLCQRLQPNVYAICGDISLIIPEELYDTMVFCLFGRTEDILSIAKQQCKRTVILIKRSYGTHRFSTEEIPIGDDPKTSTDALLKEKNIPFQSLSFEASFDQPLRSLADAKSFLSLYNRSDKEITISELREQLKPGPDEYYPFSLKNNKSLSLYVIDVKDIP